MKKMNAAMTNEEAVLIALLQLGGDLRPADVEDVAIRADAIAAGRFRWRKYKQHINIQAVGKSLRDAKSRNLTFGDSARGWSLTPSGLEAARAVVGVEGLRSRAPMSRQDIAWRAKERPRLLGEDAFCKTRAGREDAVTEREAMRSFRLDDYINGEARRARINRLARFFEGDAELAQAIAAIAAKVPK